MVNPAKCPKCGYHCLLTTAPCTVVVDETGRLGSVYGRPEILMVRKDSPVICNYSSCDWEGTTADLRDRNVPNVSDN